jgi:hypothetical protein
MKRRAFYFPAFRAILAASFALAFFNACGDGAPSGGGAAVELSFIYGESDYSSSNNIYAIWIEGDGFIQNLFVCERLVNGFHLTNTALPHWKRGVYPRSDAAEVDAVTQATKARVPFTVSATLKANCPRQFTVYYETDQSFDSNDWFNDQPALVYAADIDLDNLGNGTFALAPIGWAANEGTDDPNWGGPFMVGDIQSEMRYITHARTESSGFGAENHAESSTRAIGGIVLTVTAVPPLGTESGGPSSGDGETDGTAGASDTESVD